MFYHDNRLQYEVRVEEPDPVFAKMLQQAIGGIEGEMRVALQYFFQASAVPDNQSAYREVLLDTAAEELGHIEMLATAVHKNLQGAPLSLQEVEGDGGGGGRGGGGGGGGDGGGNGGGGGGMDLATLSGMEPRHILSTGLNALATDANGVPFNGSWVVASGNLAADMYANIMAESTGRLLATRLYHMTDDPGMKDMLAYLVARDTMHQNQWIQLLKTLGDPEEIFDVHPIPDSFPDQAENQEFNYAYMSTNVRPAENPGQPWTQGSAPDSEGEFSFINEIDLDGAPRNVSPPDPQTYNDPAPRDED